MEPSLSSLIQQAQQLDYDLVADGDLISKVACKWLHEKGYSHRNYGYNWLSYAGERWLSN